MNDDLINRKIAYAMLSEYYHHRTETQHEALWDALSRVPSAQPERWIPVTEQTLPKHNSVVVVCGNKGTWDYGTYRGHTPNNINLWNWKKNTLREVHWWMYKEDALPEPWKGEDDG